MVKRFIPIKYVILNVSICIILPLILVGVIWGIWGLTYITIPMGIILLLIVLVLSPILFYQNKDSSCIKISSTKIENPIVDRTRNNGWVEELANIQSVKITTKEECRNYYKDCSSKRVLLIDFGNGNIRYIALDWFSKRQSEMILSTIKEQSRNLQH